MLSLVASSALNSISARAQPTPADVGGQLAPVSYVISGAGYGHGRGMSQYGAYGAARKGQDWKQILSFYFPGSKRVQQPAAAAVTVWITADRDQDLRVLPAAGLRVSDTLGHSLLLPTGANYKAWAVTRAGAGYALSHRTAAGRWVKLKTSLQSSTWWFSDRAKVIPVWLPGGVRRELRGRVALVKRGTGARTVNRLPMDDYVKAVVPAEMPTSWHPNAVRAQAVAARTYAARLQALRRFAGGYDVCDTTNCQVYRGYASTTNGRRRVYETKPGNDAVQATAGTLLHFGTAAVLAEFGPSNGGSTAGSRLRYQVAKLDPYDGLVTSSAWRRTFTATVIARAWPSVGAVQGVQVTARTGVGRWGGRAKTVKIIGSKKTITVNGGYFQSSLGLRSTLFTVSAS